MNGENATPPMIDFTLEDIKESDKTRGRRRGRILYFKRVKGTAIPAGLPWKCVCGKVNTMTDREEQYCAECGSQLRHQENLNPAHTYCTLVTVKHFSLRR